MAKLVQNPNQITTGIILIGSQGTGKGKFVKTLGKIFGSHFLHLDNLDRLLGNMEQSVTNYRKIDEDCQFFFD